MPTQNRSARGKKITEWLKMKVSQITLRWAGLKVQNWCKNNGCKGNVNEEHQQMKNNNNKMKINITKTSGGSPKQVPSLGVFDYFMVIDDYL